MFEFALAQPHGHTARPYTFMVSFAGQLGLLGLSILLPVVFVDTIPAGEWLVRHFPLLPPPPRLEAQAGAPLETSTPPPARRRAGAAARLYEPVKYPPKPAILVDPDEAPGSGAGDAGRGGVPFGLGDPRSALAPLIAETLFTPLPLPAPPVVKAPPAPAVQAPRQFRIGGNVKPPAPLYTPRPEYPLLARQARIQGVVRLEAVIGADGAIRGVRLVDGPALLVQAAIAAVRTWRYTAPALNGEPIEILMNVEVKFTLGG
ncbi:MAG: energy transducer TonB [Bryobacterales bacterium]|nr:energy transducer TonB [Bryobacterales bacterium]